MKECKKPLSPEEHAKMREQKKAEFEDRLKNVLKEIEAKGLKKLNKDFLNLIKI